MGSSDDVPSPLRSSTHGEGAAGGSGSSFAQPSFASVGADEDPDLALAIAASLDGGDMAESAPPLLPSPEEVDAKWGQPAPEPPDGIQLRVRLPDGQQLTRRFAKMQTLREVRLCNGTLSHALACARVRSHALACTRIQRYCRTIWTCTHGQCGGPDARSHVRSRCARADSRCHTRLWLSARAE